MLNINEGIMMWLGTIKYDNLHYSTLQREIICTENLCNLDIN